MLKMYSRVLDPPPPLADHEPAWEHQGRGFASSGILPSPPSHSAAETIIGGSEETCLLQQGLASGFKWRKQLNSALRPSLLQSGNEGKRLTNSPKHKRTINGRWVLGCLCAHHREPCFHKVAFILRRAFSSSQELKRPIKSSAGFLGKSKPQGLP